MSGGKQVRAAPPCVAESEGHLAAGFFSGRQQKYWAAWVSRSCPCGWFVYSRCS